MKSVISYRKEENKMIYKNYNATKKAIIMKINNDINHARRDRLNGDMGTPIEEVLFNMRKILEGENIFDNKNFNF